MQITKVALGLAVVWASSASANPIHCDVFDYTVAPVKKADAAAPVIGSGAANSPISNAPVTNANAIAANGATNMNGARAPALTMDLLSVGNAEKTLKNGTHRVRVENYLGYIQLFLKEGSTKTLLATRAPEQGFSSLELSSLAPRVEMTCVDVCIDHPENPQCPKADSTLGNAPACAMPGAANKAGKVVPAK